MQICVYGASSQNIDRRYMEAAQALGEEMARRGHDLIFGGGDKGLMGAAARGVKKGGGRITGIAPTFFDQPGILYPACDEFIFTRTMRERKQLMEDRADAFIMLPGGIGTLEEFFEIITLRQLAQHAKPVAVLNTAGYYDELEALIKKAFREGFMREGSENLYHTFAGVSELLDFLESARPGL